MKVYTSLDDFKPAPNAVVSQGTFDGVHIGHQKILERLKQIAARENGETVILTFFPHPRMVLQPDDNNLKLLSTVDEKIKLMEKAGIDHLLIIPFTKEFSRLSSMQFVRDVLVSAIGVKTLVIGYDHRFGKNREGNMTDLKEFAQVYNFEVEEISAQDVDLITVSSTKIRNALQRGDVETAQRYLGHYYMASGKVVAGNRMGRKIGFPTANIFVEENYKLIPVDGVYAVRATVKGKTWKGMCNIGHQPTFTDRTHAFEVNVFDLDDDLYGETMTVEFVMRIRNEVKFSGVDALIEQLKKDKEKSLAALQSL